MRQVERRQEDERLERRSGLAFRRRRPVVLRPLVRAAADHREDVARARDRWRPAPPAAGRVAGSRLAKRASISATPLATTSCATRCRCRSSVVWTATRVADATHRDLLADQLRDVVDEVRRLGVDAALRGRAAARAIAAAAASARDVPGLDHRPQHHVAALLRPHRMTCRASSAAGDWMMPASIAASASVTLLTSLPKNRCAPSATPCTENDPRCPR